MFSTQLLTASMLLYSLSLAATHPRGWRNDRGPSPNALDVISPKVVIINMFDAEAGVWQEAPDFNLLERNVTVTGFSTAYPQAHCTTDGDVCQIVTAMGGERSELFFKSGSRPSRASSLTLRCPTASSLKNRAFDGHY